MTWVIGNGESRTNVNIEKLQGYKIGCNAIARDYHNIDAIVCVDRRMVYEALDRNFTNKIMTRQQWIDRFTPYPNVKLVPPLPYKGIERPDEPFQWGSGPYAVLAGTQYSSTIRMVGFDLYGNEGYINNLYKDTENYDKSTKSSIDPRYWIHQIGKVFECCPKKKFIIYQKTGWELPNAWRHPNVSLDKISKIV